MGCAGTALHKAVLPDQADEEPEHVKGSYSLLLLKRERNVGHVDDGSAALGCVL